MNNKQERKFFQYLATITTPTGVLNQSMGGTSLSYPSNRELIERVKSMMLSQNVYVMRVDILSFSELSKEAYCAFFELDPETLEKI